MVDVLRVLQAGIATPGAGESPVRWVDLKAAMQHVMSAPIDWQIEDALLSIVRHRGKINIVQGGELPHSMPPDEMLKALAVQAIVKATGPTHLAELRRVELLTASASLRSVIRAATKQAGTAQSPMEKRIVVEAVPRHITVKKVESQDSDWRSTQHEVASVRVPEKQVIRRAIYKQGGLSYLAAKPHRLLNATREFERMVKRKKAPV